MLYRACFVAHYAKTSFSQLTSRLKQSSKNVINHSEEGTSNKSLEKELICNSVSSNALLDVFIPCKLSNNEGFEKINLLKNIRFTANKGEVLTFLDSANISKAILFKILVNDEKSDSHVEKDLVGRVYFG